ncbi:MAG: cbb3-type cytochrome oxidase assembly protein CcoS [Bdellovibrionales bacterium CG10_big_fil_rev_8_21_14_0_10_45_34]|nr:MAG: cbb3-type cytochrome oxidase assembly protein CcoS [Bdellovibrionales bacterium CG10_big_fil_rev_8_21_14_0_10_45_34]
MNILLLTIPVSIGLAAIFVILFVKAVKSDQFEDLETPALNILIEDEALPKNDKIV